MKILLNPLRGPINKAAYCFPPPVLLLLLLCAFDATERCSRTRCKTRPPPQTPQTPQKSSDTNRKRKTQNFHTDARKQRGSDGLGRSPSSCFSIKDTFNGSKNKVKRQKTTTTKKRKSQSPLLVVQESPQLPGNIAVTKTTRGQTKIVPSSHQPHSGSVRASLCNRCG